MTTESVLLHKMKVDALREIHSVKRGEGRAGAFGSSILEDNLISAVTLLCLTYFNRFPYERGDEKATFGWFHGDLYDPGSHHFSGGSAK